MALARKGSNIRAGVRRGNNRASTGYYGGYRGYNRGYYGGYGGRSVAGSAIRRQERAGSSQFKVTEWKKLEDEQAKMRRTLTQRYQVEF